MSARDDDAEGREGPPRSLTLETRYQKGPFDADVLRSAVMLGKKERGKKPRGPKPASRA